MRLAWWGRSTTMASRWHLEIYVVLGIHSYDIVVVAVGTREGSDDLIVISLTLSLSLSLAEKLLIRKDRLNYTKQKSLPPKAQRRVAPP